MSLAGGGGQQRLGSGRRVSRCPWPTGHRPAWQPGGSARQKHASASGPETPETSHMETGRCLASEARARSYEAALAPRGPCRRARRCVRGRLGDPSGVPGLVSSRRPARFPRGGHRERLGRRVNFRHCPEVLDGARRRFSRPDVASSTSVHAWRTAGCAGYVAARSATFTTPVAYPPWVPLHTAESRQRTCIDSAICAAAPSTSLLCPAWPLAFRRIVVRGPSSLEHSWRPSSLETVRADA